MAYLKEYKFIVYLKDTVKIVLRYNININNIN